MTEPGLVPTFTDGVLTLSGYTATDAAAHVAGEDEETARRFGWWPAVSTEAGVLAAFERWAESWRTGGPVRTFAARDSRTGELVGGCELRIDSADSGFVSYWTGAQHRRKGYAVRALRLLREYAVSIGVGQLEADVADDNFASRRVAENCGFALAGDYIDEQTAVHMIRYLWPGQIS